MARTPEQQVGAPAKKMGARSAGAQAFGKIADVVTPPDVPAGVRAFDSMASTVAPPSAPTLPGTALAVPDRPNFTMPPPGPTTAVAPRTRPNWTIPPAGTPAPPGTAVAVSNRPNFTMPGPEVLGTGPAAVRNNAGAVDALVKAPAAPKPTLAMRAEPIIHGLVPGIAGALTAGAVNDGRQKEAEAQYAKTVAAAQPYTAKPGEIPKAIDGTVPQAGPAPVAGSFLNQSEAGRNVGNAMMALPGGGLGIKAAQTALTALPIAARGVRAAQTAVPATVAAAQGFAGGDANFPGRPTAPAAQAVGPNQASYSNEGNNYSTPEKVQTLRPPPFDPAGKIIKTVGADGKVSYSGDNVKFGGDIYSPDGKVVNGGDPKNPKGFGVTSLDTSEGHRQNLLELQRLQSERAQREAGFAGNQPGGGLAGFGGGTLSSGLRDKVNREATPDMSGMSNRQRAQMMMNDRQLAQAREMAQMQDATQRYGTDTSAKATMRGQDMQLMGHKMTNQIALANRQYEMFKDQRNYELDVKKFGQTQADANRAARESEDKAWTASAEKRFVTKVDGKDVVDANKVAEFTKAADATVPEFIKLLQQTGTPQALAKAKELSARGKAALGPEDHNMLHKLMEMREVSRAGHGWQPGKGAHIETDNLLAYLPKGKDTGLFGNPITVTEGGSRIPTNKLEYGPDDNAWLPTFQPRRTDLTSIR